MKRITLSLLSLAFSVAAMAADVARPAMSAPELQPLQITFADMMKSAAIADGRGPRQPVPNVVLEGSEAGFVFPIVGSAAGSGGTFFRSETVIYNRANRRQEVALYYFPAGGGPANCNRAAQRMTLDANSWYVWPDFVADVFHTSGLGAVIVLGITQNGQIDTTARIDGNSRIWTPQPGTNGTASQNFPSVSLSMPAGGQSAFGLRHDEFYRSNYGIFNYDLVSRTFDVAVNGTRSETTSVVTVPACNMVLQNIGGGPYGSYELFIAARDGRAQYFTFGSSVDNATGDSWSVIGRSF